MISAIITSLFIVYSCMFPSLLVFLNRRLVKQVVELLRLRCLRHFGFCATDSAMATTSSSNVFKIPADKCRCRSRKIIKFGAKSLENSTLDVFFNQISHLNAFSILKPTLEIGDFNIVHSLLSEMVVIHKDKCMPNPKFLPLARGFLETFLRVHPPCEEHTFKEYLRVLEENKRFSGLLKEMGYQVELVSKKALPESSQRNKGRRRHTDSRHGDDDCVIIVEKLQAIEESSTKKFGQLPPSDVLAHLFSALAVLVSIIEKDFETWKATRSSGLITSKSYRPLIVHLLWKDVMRFDRDAICNKLCLDIFKLYNNCLHNKVSPPHLRVVARLINVTAEVVELIGRHQEAKPQEGYHLQADFGNFVYQGRVDSGFHGFALKEIENGRRKLQKPVLYHFDEGTAIGNLCKEFAQSFATSIGRCTCEDVRECLVLEKAFIFIKPPWLLHLTTCCLLKQDSDVGYLKSAVRGALTADEDLSTQKHRLRAILFSSAVDTFQMLGYSTSGQRRDVRRPSKRIKLDQAAVKTDNDQVDDLIHLIKTQMIKTF